MQPNEIVASEVVSGVGSVDGHEPRLLVPVVRLDDQMRDAPRLRVDDDIGQLTEGVVGAPDRTTQVESHRPPRPPRAA